MIRRWAADRRAFVSGVRIYGTRGREMRVLLSVYGSCGDLQPLLGLAVALRDLGAEV